MASPRPQLTTPPPAARLSATFLATVDDRLADTDTFLARAYPGEDGRRQPVHTVYVPADRYDRGLPQRWGAEAKALVSRARRVRPAVRGARAPGRPRGRGRPPGGGQARHRADRGPAARLRGRLRPSGRRRGGRRRGPGGPRAEHRAGRGRGPGLHGPAVQVLRGADPAPGAADPGPVPVHPARGRSAPGRADHHLPEGQHGRPGRGHGRRLRGVRERRRAAPRPARVRDPGRDPAARPRRRRAGGDRGRPARRGRSGDLTALRHLRLQRLARRLRGVPVDGPSRRRLRQGGHAGRRRRHRGAPVRRIHQRPPGRLRRRGARGLAAAPLRSSGAAWSAPTTRAGTCTPDSCRPGSWPTSPSTGRVSPGRPAG